MLYLYKDYRKSLSFWKWKKIFMDISTKIVCTIGPAVCSLKKIIELMKAGMNVARINFSHGDYTVLDPVHS